MFQDFITKAVKPFHPDAQTALDFGCGPGPVLAGLLRDSGISVDTYDPYFAPDMAYQEKNYDLITATEVVEHLSDPISVLRHLTTLLKLKGILAIMTLFHPNEVSLFQQWWYRRDPTHVAFYSPRTLQMIAKHLQLNLVFHDNRRIAVFRKDRIK